jgi:sulfate adenylyltransferase large subunit
MSGAPQKTQTTQEVQEYFDQREKKDLLCLVAVGSVDDGKSTLIGRLLHDTQGVYDDQLRAVHRASHMAGAEIDYSLFTDGLKAEREQGITIDVAYRYFTTSKRKFILADTPGHVQYTRNMATGASTASAAILLIDARLGVLQQSRRHAYIASLLRIPHLVVGVNKMDLVAYAQSAYEPIVREFGAFAGKLGFASVTFIPLSALKGDNVVERSARMPYYDGATVLELLERLPVAGHAEAQALRYPVQLALRPNLDYRGYAGQVASGVVRAGDTVTILPSRKTTRVVGIDLYGESLAEAFPPLSVTLRLADEVDVSRGDMIVHAHELPRAENQFDATLIWLHERPLDRAKSYLLKHTTQVVRAEVEEVAHQIDLETLERVPAATLGLNDIGQVAVRTHRPLFVDAYADNRATGAFILIDSLTNDTVAAGMVLEPRATSEARGAPSDERGERVERTHVSPTERRARLGHGAMALVVPASAEARARAFAIERHLFDHGVLAAALVDGTTGARGRDLAAALVRAGVVAVCVLDEGDAQALAAQSLPLYALAAPEASVDDGAEALAALTEAGVLGAKT